MPLTAPIVIKDPKARPACRPDRSRAVGRQCRALRALQGALQGAWWYLHLRRAAGGLGLDTWAPGARRQSSRMIARDMQPRAGTRPSAMRRGPACSPHGGRLIAQTAPSSACPWPPTEGTPSISIPVSISTSNSLSLWTGGRWSPHQPALSTPSSACPDHPLLPQTAIKRSLSDHFRVRQRLAELTVEGRLQTPRGSSQVHACEDQPVQPACNSNMQAAQREGSDLCRGEIMNSVHDVRTEN